MILIDGTKVATDLKVTIKERVAAMDRKPGLVAILVGGDGASETYVANKEKACKDVGFNSQVLKFEDTITEAELLAEIERLNNDDAIDGFIVQLPLPLHISENAVIEAIDPAKDVDGFHPINVGKMILGLPANLSATPMGIVELFRAYGIETRGKNCVVLGRSNIVGRPVANLLSTKEFDCTVTICHTHTKDLHDVIRRADILIAAIGQPLHIKADMIKEGAVVIDAGITRIKSDKTKSGWKVVGDVDFESVAPKCSYITPVPGGVGPMTIVSLMMNTLNSAILRGK